MACGGHSRCNFAVHDLLMGKPAEPVLNLSRLFDDVRDWSFPLRFAGSNNPRSVVVRHSADRIRAKPDTVRFCVRHVAPGGWLWQKSKPRLKGRLAWTGKLGHAGRPLFCAYRNDCVVAPLPDSVPIPSLSSAWVWSQLSPGRRLNSVQNRF